MARTTGWPALAPVGGVCSLKSAQESGRAAQCSGVAAEGLVEAAASPGPVVWLVLDPEVKRLDEVVLAEHVSAAFNAALHDLGAILVMADESLPDLASLANQLRDLQDQTFHALHEIGSKINVAMEAAGESARLDDA
jgi:hypothetical protein